MPTPAPLVFDIGLPYSGSDVLEALFVANGYKWRHHMSGKIAQDIAYALAAGTPMLAPWAGATGFSGLYSMANRHLPHIRVQEIYRGLHEAFPDAFFVHTHRDPADWVALRYLAQDGEHKTESAWHAGIEIADLPAHWLAEQQHHAKDVARYFEGNTRFLDFNCTTQHAEKLIEFLRTEITLDVERKPQPLGVSAEDIRQVVDDVNNASEPYPPSRADMIFVRQVSDFCKQTKGPPGNGKSLSRSAVNWHSDNSFTARRGDPPRIALGKGGFVMPPDENKRVEGTLNELSAHGAQPPLQIDMLDARFMGSDGYGIAPRKTVVYNRRKNAPNLTLWPLPGYHTLAPRGAVGGFPIDDVPFPEKSDRCVWLGNMTGRMSAVLTPEERPRRGVYKIRDDAYATDPDWDNIIADLACVPRYRVVATHRGDPDFDVGFVLAPKWKRLAQSPAFKGLTSPRQTRTWFHQFKYILSLSGNDTGSNFLSAAASNSLILKEEDGWELFYTDAFKPWIHYVPLIEGALDIREKLSWARANPDRCEHMVQAATDMYDRFANPNNRAAYLRAIASDLNSS